MLHPDNETSRAIARLGNTPDFARFATHLQAMIADELDGMMNAARDDLPERRARVQALRELNDLIESAPERVRSLDDMPATGTPQM